jgi:hypothetical protein
MIEIIFWSFSEILFPLNASNDGVFKGLFRVAKVPKNAQKYRAHGFDARKTATKLR